MSRSPKAALSIALVAVALAGSACGRYGPPVRALEAAAHREQSPPPEPITAPTAPDDPVVPDQEP